MKIIGSFEINNNFSESTNFFEIANSEESLYMTDDGMSIQSTLDLDERFETLEAGFTEL